MNQKTTFRILSHSEYILWRLHENVAVPSIYLGYSDEKEKFGAKTSSRKALKI